MQTPTIITQAGGAAAPSQPNTGSGAGDAFLALLAGLRGGAEGLGSAQPGALPLAGEAAASNSQPPAATPVVPDSGNQAAVPATSPPKQTPQAQAAVDDGPSSEGLAALLAKGKTAAGTAVAGPAATPTPTAVPQAAAAATATGQPATAPTGQAATNPGSQPSPVAAPTAPTAASSQSTPAQPAQSTATTTTAVSGDVAKQATTATPADSPVPAKPARAVPAGTADQAAATVAKATTTPRERLAQSPLESAPAGRDGKPGIRPTSAPSTTASAGATPAESATAGQATQAGASAALLSGQSRPAPAADAKPDSSAAAATPQPVAPGHRKSVNQRASAATAAAGNATGAQKSAPPSAKPTAQAAEPATPVRAPLWSASQFAATSAAADPLQGGMAMGGEMLDGGLDPLPGSGTTSNAGAAKAASELYAGSTLRGFAGAPAAQVAVQIQRAIGAQANRFSIRLEPAELGRVDVQLDFARDGSVRASITVERPETFELMQRDLQSLERSLKDSGSSGQQLSLDLNLGTDAQRDREAWREALGDGGTASAESATADDEVPPEVAAQQTMTLEGLVDIRI